MKSNKQLPIKAYPKEKLKQELFDLGIFISELVSLKTEKKNDLKDALKGVVELCKNYSFKEIRTMFKLYRDSQLDIRPMTNHIDRILVGQIVQAYEKWKLEHQQSKKGHLDRMEELEKEKETEDYLNVVSWFDWFIQNRKVTKEMTWIYDYLILKDKEFTPKEKFRIRLVQRGIDDGMVIVDAKAKAHRTLLRIYFERLEDRGIHIKDLL